MTAERFGARLLAGVAALGAAVGCPFSRVPDNPRQDAGCTGICDDSGYFRLPDGGLERGPDGGSGKDAGVDGGLLTVPCADAGATLTLAQVRAVLEGGCPSPTTGEVFVQPVVVSGVMDAYVESQAGLPGDAGSRAFFWVQDEQPVPSGVWVQKAPSDWAVAPDGGRDYLYTPAPGDRLSLDGYPFVVDPWALAVYNQAFRPALGGGAQPMRLKVLDAGAVPGALSVSAGFGNALGGVLAANPEAGGTRIHIPGPLLISDARPAALTRYAPDSFPPVPAGWNGFEVDSAALGAFEGVLVADSKTRSGCDFGGLVRDGGAVLFPGGISGIWDTYAAQPCADAGQPCPNAMGQIPVADGGFRPGYLYVLWLLDCADL